MSNIENIVYVVQTLEGDILGIYEEIIDAKQRQQELFDDGWEVILDDYILNVDVNLIESGDPEVDFEEWSQKAFDEVDGQVIKSNVLEFKQ